MYRPDILECLANLSSDEVFTPPSFSKKMLDRLPDWVWRDPSLKWLDPCAKSGVFLYQVAQRLMESLKSEIPDYGDRLEHIYRNMLYGIAISELTGLISRRTLYQCKDASLETHSIIKFDDPEGNIRFPEVKDERKDRKRIHSGISERSTEVAEGREAHISPFLHMDLDEIFGEENMQVNVIMGNPPYQMQDGGGTGKSAIPLYNRFVEKAKAIEPDVLTFVIPARWYAGGKGLDGFRKRMLSDPKISLLADYPQSEDVFPDVDIAGGICSFLWDKSHEGDCLVMPNGETKGATLRRLDANDVFVRDGKDVAILEKVWKIAHEREWNSMSRVVRSSNFYGIRPHELPSTVTDKPQSQDAILLVTKDGDKYVPRHEVIKNADTIDHWKVIISKTNPQGGKANKSGFRQVISKPRVIPPGSVLTETYLVVDIVRHHEPAGRLLDYLKTRFFRFLVSLRTPTQNLSRTCFNYVPLLPMDQNWTDEILYDIFKLDSAQIEHIESKIKLIN